MEVGFGRAVVETRVDLERYDPVPLDSLGHVVRSTSLGKVQLSVQTDVFVGLVHERMANDPHFREVHFGASGAQNLVFEQREGRVAPARTAAVLVFDRRGGEHFRVGEPVSFGFGGCFGCFGRSGECDAAGESGQQNFFHALSVFGFDGFTFSNLRRFSGSRRASALRVCSLSAAGSFCLCMRYRDRSGRS